MEVYELSKVKMQAFLEALAQDSLLFAPVKRQLVRYARIKKGGASQIFLGKNAYFPVKEYFFSKHETLYEYKEGKIAVPKLESPEMIFFGLRRCDLNGIMHQDKVFTEQVKDPYYLARRKNSILLGYHCESAPSPFCFCGSMNLKEFSDLMFFDRKSSFIVEVGSDKGRALIAKYKKLFKQSGKPINPEEKKIKNADRLNKKDIAKYYGHPDWVHGVNQCLSCAACTNLCPTCYCFEFKEELKADGSSKKNREWSSCQLQDFTRVAGEHVFRQKREDRFLHRIYHQLQYFKEKNGVDLCVGCGRCIEGCPTRIDFVDILNKMN